MKKIFSKEVVIAITVLLSLGILYWGMEYLKGINLFKPNNFYYAKFEKVNGLAVAAPITVNGFQVGQVHDIDYDYENNQISVMLNLNEKLHIPQGSSIALTSDMLGTSSLVINFADGNSYYKVGDVIPTSQKAGLMDAAGNMLPKVEQLLPKIDSILTNLNKVVANPAINNSVTRLDAISAELESSSKQLSAVMRTMPTVMNNVNGITTNLNTTSKNINTFTGTLNEMPLDQTAKELEATVSNLKQLSEALNNKNSTLGLITNDRKLYDNINKSVESLDTLLTDIKAHPKRYVTIKVF